MKLYFMPGACSLSPHIALREAGLEFEIDRVVGATKMTRSGENFLDVNPKGQVPTLRLDDGTVLTEGPSIVQYIADLAPASGLAPANGTIERYKLQSWLGYINSEFHKLFTPLFSPKASDEVKAWAREQIAQRLTYLNGELSNREWLTGDRFTVADGYLFTVLGWTRPVNIDLTPYPALQAFSGRVFERPAVQAAMKAEGLLK